MFGRDIFRQQQAAAQDNGQPIPCCKRQGAGAVFVQTVEFMLTGLEHTAIIPLQAGQQCVAPFFLCQRKHRFSLRAADRIDRIPLRLAEQEVVCLSRVSHDFRRAALRTAQQLFRFQRLLIETEAYIVLPFRRFLAIQLIQGGFVIINYIDFSIRTTHHRHARNHTGQAVIHIIESV